MKGCDMWFTIKWLLRKLFTGSGIPLLGTLIASALLITGYIKYNRLESTNKSLLKRNAELIKELKSCQSVRQVEKLYCSTYMHDIDMNNLIEDEDNETITYDFSKLGSEPDSSRSK